MTTGRAENAKPLKEASGNKNNVPLFENPIKITKNSLIDLKKNST